MIIDGRRALAGSQNLSTGSLQYNRELSIMVSDAPSVAQFAADFAADYAGRAYPGTSMETWGS
jgi:phosphatidylserine/phosphatidylglycerophosphate/cardiolipin synthase-like enzyme